MKISIIPSDRFMSIDGKGLFFDLSGVPGSSGIHAIQWHETKGHIERPGQPNEILTEPSFLAPYISVYEAEVARLESARLAELAIYNSPAKVAERAEEAEHADITLLINAELREIAITELKKKGKLTAEGKIKK